MASNRPENGRTVLYRFFGVNDRLLYVGITDRLGQRWENHMRNKPWWPKVIRQTCEWHPTRGAAVDAEIEAIRNEGPLYNSQYAATPDLGDIALRSTWQCPACPWRTCEPVELVQHIQMEARKRRAGSREDADSLARTAAKLRSALDQAAALTKRASEEIVRMTGAPRRLRRRPALAPTVTQEEMSDLLRDMDALLGNKRVRLAEIPPLLRQRDPDKVLYCKLNGVQLGGILRRAGIRTLNTGGIRLLDPNDLRAGMSRAT